jgi:hypothetical protein
VERFAFYAETNAIHILLNHECTRKSIVFSVDKKDWNKTHDIFEKLLKQRGISKEHIALLSDTIDDNYHVILSLEQQHQQQEREPPQTDESTNNNGKHEDGDGDKQPKESAAQIALRLAQEQCSDIFMDQFGTPYAAINVGDHIETLPMKHSRFRNWLCRMFYTSTGGNILTSDNVTNVLSILKAKAEFDSGDRKNLYLRVGTLPEEPNTIYYDLTNKDWQIVKITPQGWSIIESKDAPILFKRYNNQRPQVILVNQRNILLIFLIDS